VHDIYASRAKCEFTLDLSHITTLDYIRVNSAYTMHTLIMASPTVNYNSCIICVLIFFFATEYQHSRLPKADSHCVTWQDYDAVSAISSSADCSV